MQEQNDLQSMQGNQIDKLDNRKFSRFELAAQIVGSLFIPLNLCSIWLFAFSISMTESSDGIEGQLLNVYAISVIIIDIIFLANIRKPRRMRSIPANIFDAFFWLIAVAMIILLLYAVLPR